MTISNKGYQDLIRIENFKDRLEYLRCFQIVGDSTFGGDRYLNQMLYQFKEWKQQVRRKVILRDNGCDLAHPDHPIVGNIYVHHIQPITREDILQRRSCVFDLNNLVCTSFDTHNAIHYGRGIEKELEIEIITERKYGDTTLW